MFYDHVFTADQKQTLLSVAESQFLVRLDCPDYLKKSKHAITIRHTVTNRGEQRRSGSVSTAFVPRVRSSDVQRLLREVRVSQSVSSAHSLSDLFVLGLGVPKQLDIAHYLRSYTADTDKKGIGIKYIRKLVDDYQRKYRRSFAGSRWLMPAEYTANLMYMQSFIHLEENGYSKKLRVPEGIPVVLIYQSTSSTDSEFAMCDAFAISPLGYAIPFAQIALRPEFKAAPRTFTSKALRGKGMYSMIMGIMHWQEGDSIDKFRELMDIDDEPYITLLNTDEYADRRSPEYQTMLEMREDLNSKKTKWFDVLNTYGNTTRVLKPAQEELLEQAHEFFKTRKSFMDDFDKFEKKENAKASRRFAVASAQFAAIDCGTILDRSTYMAVSSPLSMVNKILTKWGFTTIDTVNSSLKTTTLTYNPDSTTRVWSL